jgi:hypothetical protein
MTMFSFNVEKWILITEDIKIRENWVESIWNSSIHGQVLRIPSDLLQQLNFKTATKFAKFWTFNVLPRIGFL